MSGAPDLQAIVAVDEQWGIGKNGDLLAHISADLRRFKALTTGHPVILGRKTLSTFPGGRPLPGRRNLILSHDPGFAPEGAEVFRDLGALLSAAPADSMVIGGESIYRALLDRCRRVYVTKILQRFDADAWFPDLDDDWRWGREEPASPPQEENGLRFQFVNYERLL